MSDESDKSCRSQEADEKNERGIENTKEPQGEGLSRRSFLVGGAITATAMALGNVVEAKSTAKKATGRPKSMLVKNASVLVTMDKTRREIKDGGLYIEDGVIKQVDSTDKLPKTAEVVIDMKGQLVLPGLVNTHQHLYQHLTRVAPACQDGNVWNWLRVLYPMWARMTPDSERLAVQVGLAELALSGCTTVFDQQYVFPNGCKIDDAIDVAKDMGIRFHASRGSMSLGQSKGGLPPDSCVENESDILNDCQRVIDRYHDMKPGAMTRIVLAPCSPFSVTDDLMTESAKLARKHKCGLHTHLAESLDEERYTLKKYNLRPVDLMEKFGWLGDDVWFAHSVHINDAEIQKYAKTGSGIAHCPSSNMRLASGISPIKKCRDAGVKVGLGVDGSSSNDCSHMLAEVRMSMLLARTLLSENPGGPPEDKKAWLSARDALEMATIGGAAVIGRDDIGSLEVGKRADFFSVNTNQIGFAGGSMVDPVASLVFCTPQNATYTVIEGRIIVKEGQIQTLDLPVAIEKLNKASRQVMNA
jgi:cytosine/adenosine deaminase-related metal-dependent hydrolase